MATLREKIIERIDVHIEMTEESVQDSIKHAATLSDAETESVAYDLKQIRNLKHLQEYLKNANVIPSTMRSTLFDVLEEMMDLDI